MDTAASTSNGGGFGIPVGVNQGYAIPINQALALANQIKAGKASATIQIGPRALLGVAVSDGSSSGGTFGGAGGGSGTAGAYVQRVQSGSPADTAGIGAGDTVMSVNGTTISVGPGPEQRPAAQQARRHVTVGWVDAQGTSHTASVQLIAGPPA